VSRRAQQEELPHGWRLAVALAVGIGWRLGYVALMLLAVLVVVVNDPLWTLPVLAVAAVLMWRASTDP